MRRKILQRLYDLNPGALPRSGYGLPLRLTVAEHASAGRLYRLMSRNLRRTGSEITPARADEDTEFGYELRIELDTELRFRLLRSTEILAEGGLAVSGQDIRELCYRLSLLIVDELYQKMFRARGWDTSA